MSRSHRNSPYMGLTTASSDKPYKVDEHRAERRVKRQRLRISEDGDHPLLHKVYGDPWGAPKDGKQEIIGKKSKWLRK